MKLCDITQFFTPFSGGVKRYLFSKDDFIRAHPGMEHVLIVPGNKDECEKDGSLTRYMVRSPPIPGTQSYRMMLRFSEIRRILNQESPDLVEVGDPYQLGWAAVKLTGELNLPLVAFYHSDYPRALGRTVERFVSRRAVSVAEKALSKYLLGLYNQMNGTLVASEKMLSILHELGIEKLHHTPIGIDLEVFHPREVRQQVRRQLGIDEHRILILYVGRMSREKNIRLLLSMMNFLEYSVPGLFHLLLVGQGHLDRVVQRAARDNDSITWRPYCTDQDRLAEIYSSADVFVHAGMCETYGLVALESQACGTPFVSVRGSGIDVLNQAGEAFLADAPDAVSLGETVLAARSCLSEPLRAKVAKRMEERFEVADCFRRQFEIYDQILQSHRNSSKEPPAEKPIANEQNRQAG